MSRTDPTAYIRLPPEVMEEVKQAAQANRRSMTGEIAARLANSDNKQPRKSGALQQTDPQFKLRLAGELLDQCTRAANSSKRSINAEINHRLEVSFGDPTVLRDQFAGLAMQGLVTANKPISIVPHLFHREANLAYAIADAMLIARAVDPLDEAIDKNGGRTWL